MNKIGDENNMDDFSSKNNIFQSYNSKMEEHQTNYQTKLQINMNKEENNQNFEEKLLDEKNVKDEKLIKDDKMLNMMIELNEEKDFINIAINNSGITTKEEIIEIFEKKGEKFKEYKNKLEQNNIMNNISQSMNKNKKKKTKNKIIKTENIEKYEIKEELKRGRKKKGDNTESSHNKYSPDNIMKKIKDYLLKKLVELININLENIGYDEYEIYKLNYKELVDKSDKNFNLQLLDMAIKELLSKKIFGKYKTKSPNRNKENIEEILKKGGNNEIIKYIFNISFRDWIDIFIMKRESSIRNVKFEGIDSLLEEINKDKNSDDKYFCNFVFCLYNYERYWLCKRNRKNKIKK